MMDCVLNAGMNRGEIMETNIKQTWYYPNDNWNLEITKPMREIELLDIIVDSLLAKGVKELCIIKAQYGFILFRKADKDELHLITQNRKPIQGRIVKRWKNGKEVKV